MKKLLLMLCLVPALVQAGSFYTNNSGGGRIVITDRDCKMNGRYYGTLRAAYAYLENGKAIDACWAYLDGAVHVVYDDGERRIYPLESFQPLD